MSGELNWSGKRVTITGGAGFLGKKLAEQLIRQGAEKVVLLDVRPPITDFILIPLDEWNRKTTFVACDICDYNQVQDAVKKGNDCVFHICSFGMSGKDNLNVERIEQINVKGTENVIRSCQEHNVQALIYTSTTNVCFNGLSELPNKDETLPYCTVFVDAYSRTKAAAEQLSLKANNSHHRQGKGRLYTCAIRPAGIYGEGEERILPRVVSLMYKGLFVVTVGSKNSKVEFVHVDNLASAHIRAAERLLKLPLSAHQNPKLPQNPEQFILLQDEQKDKLQNKVAGQVYFVSDCHPINNFEFFRPLIEGLGYRYPRINLPFWLMFRVAWMNEIIYGIMSKVIDYNPSLTRCETCKVGVTHYFKPDKAIEHLNYRPVVSYEEGMERVVAHIKKHMPPPPPTPTNFPLLLLALTIPILAFLWIVFGWH